jgi:presenilin-like A22 family membrane protease
VVLLSGKVKHLKSKFSPLFWGSLVMVLALALTLYVAGREKLLFEAIQFASPDISLWAVVAYFFGVVLALALVLFLIPLRKLRFVFQVLFTLMFAWGVFVIAGLISPPFVAYPVAIIAGVVWLFWARVWFHDLIYLVTLAAAGSVFGFLFSPWTFMIFMLVIAVYDVLAVRFGFMVWMADKLSESTTLPAFIFPKNSGDWNLSLKKIRISDLQKEEPGARDYAILGGGDIGFPLMLAASVFFKSNLVSGMVVGGFAVLGLMSAFLIQMYWLKGKPMPALPPIALFSLIGFVIASRFLGL